MDCPENLTLKWSYVLVGKIVIAPEIISNTTLHISTQLQNTTIKTYLLIKRGPYPKNFWDGLISSKERIIYVKNLLHQGIQQLLDKS